MMGDSIEFENATSSALVTVSRSSGYIGLLCRDRHFCRTENNFPRFQVKLRTLQIYQSQSKRAISNYSKSTKFICKLYFFVFLLGFIKM